MAREAVFIASPASLSFPQDESAAEAAMAMSVNTILLI